MRIRNLKSLVFSIPLAVLAQTPALEMSHIYQCPGGQAFEVFSCAGPGATDACDVQTFQQGQALPRGKAPRQQVMLLFQICQLPQGGARGGAAAAPGQARSQVGPGGFGLRLSTRSGGRLWAQVWFGQPATLRVSRNRDSSGKSRNRRARLLEVVGRVLNALLTDQEINELGAFLASETRP